MRRMEKRVWVRASLLLGYSLPFCTLAEPRAQGAIQPLPPGGSPVWPNVSN